MSDVICPHCSKPVDEDAILYAACFAAPLDVVDGEVIFEIECPSCDKTFKMRAEIQVELVSAHLVEA